MLKRGTTREDGKIFYAYRKRKNKPTKEIWLTKEQFEKWETTRKKYRDNGLNAYKKEQMKLPKEERNVLGKYNPENGLYFIQIFCNAKIRYGTWEEVQEFRERRKRNQRIASKRRKTETPLPTVCVGDKHPTDENLIVIKIRYNKVFYGPPEKLEHRKQQQKIWHKKHCEKFNKVEQYKKIRQEKLKFLNENPHLKFKRGDVNPVTSQRFWGYTTLGNENWLTIENFEKKKERERQKGKRRQLVLQNKKLQSKAT